MADHDRLERDRPAAREKAAERSPAGPSGSPMHHLQRSAGNAAVLASLGAQAKLTVGAADDAAEREADSIARQVVRRILGGGGARPDGPTASDGIARRIRRRATPEPAPMGLEGGDVDRGTEQALQSARSSGGEALPGTARRSMEDAFGTDFSGVRVHTGAKATELNRSLGASAFTVGSDIFFSGGVPDTGTTAGAELLAHELTHTVQQGAAPVSRTIRREPEEKEGPETESSEMEEALGGAAEEAKEEALEEDEGHEVEAEEDGPLPELAGSIGSGGPGIEVVKDPGGGAADRATPPSYRSNDVDDGPIEVGIRVNTNLHASSVERTPTGRGGKSDGIAATVGNVGWTNPGNKAVDPFGEESFEVEYRNANYRLGANRGDDIVINLDLAAKCAWGVKSDGQIDIPNASSPHVTADTADQIVADLTPAKEEKSWRAPRDVYWSKSICERHEKFHSTDDKAWVENAGKTRFENFLNGSTISMSSATRKDPGKVVQRIRAKLDAAIADLDTANFEFYTGGAGSYLSYAGEERAFGDGKQPYLDLAAAVQAKGDQLKEERRQAGLAPEERSVAAKKKMFEKFQGGS